MRSSKYIPFHKRSQNDFQNRNESGNSSSYIENLLTEMVKDDYQENIALKLLDPSVNIENFLNDPSNQETKYIRLIMKVTLKASENNLMKNNFRKYLQILVNSDFLKRKLDIFISTELCQNMDMGLLHLVLSFMTLLFVTIPGQVYDILFLRLQNISMLLENMILANKTIDNAILSQLEELKVLAQSSCPYRMNNKHASTADIAPPDDYRQISIYPTVKDLLNTENEDVFLRKNKKFGTYQSVDDYLDVQFRLMREDFIQPLRDGLSHYMHSSKKKFGIRIYRNVSVLQASPSQRNGIIHDLKFDYVRLKHVKWEQSKRFLYGSLLCLSHDDFQTLTFATIINRKNEDLEKGIISVKFERSNPDKTKIYTILETTNLFESYKHVLLKLQETTEDNLPMKQYLVFAEQDISPPGYLMRNKQLKYEVNEYCMSPGLDEPNWPNSRDLNMDNSQFKAFQSSLTKELTIIQGPPGTGKTFLGLKICETLIENVQRKIDGFGPILVVCYTNHALDQFLEGISEFSEKIVRIGGRSKSEKLEKFQLFGLKRLDHRSFYKNNYYNNLREVEANFLNLRATIDLSDYFILRLDVIKEFMLESQFVYLQDIGLIDWLNGDSVERHWTEIDDELVNIVDWLLHEEIQDQISSITKLTHAEILNMGNESNNVDDPDIEVNYINNERKLDIDYEDNDQASKKIMAEIRSSTSAIFDSGNISSSDELGVNKDLITTKNLVFTRMNMHEKMTDIEFNEIRSLADLSMKDRWRLYRFLVHRYIESIQEKFQSIEDKYQDLNQQLIEVGFEEDRMVMMNQEIIGMTTSGAARYGRVLAQIKCKIIIVEEAAEVLESHIVASLNPDCEHVILIGDHKQLKPSATVYKLAKQFNLDLSLFERLINNNLHFNALALQHRMRPEIADVIKYFYKTLDNHNDVLYYPNVPAVRCNMFFFDHKEPERLNEDILSYSNSFEANFVVKFCQYLLKNGVEHSKITILTLYTGQMFLLRKLMPRKSFDGVRVCVVDNFQGEENDIILLSLVRSNEDEKIGFLNIENRICVCLSRAKHGLYVFGNFTILANQSELWNTICEDLKRKQLLGGSLGVFCKNHPTKQRDIMRPDDFSRYPEGGCDERCNKRLQCGHSCRNWCHFMDKNHLEYQCEEMCTKSCQSGHPCPLKCWQDCGLCNTLVSKRVSSCGHDQIVACGLEPESSDCAVICERILPCGHSGQFACGEPSTLCMVVLISKCKKLQHWNEHKCCEKPICQQKCPLSCPNGHLCKFKCFENCGSCFERVSKQLPCGHLQILECDKSSNYPNKFDCKVMFELRRQCGHKSIVQCGRKSHPCSFMVVKKCAKCQNQRRIKCCEVRSYRCEYKERRTCKDGHWYIFKCGQNRKCLYDTRKRMPICQHEIMRGCSEEPLQIDCVVPSRHQLSCGHEMMLPCNTKLMLEGTIQSYSAIILRQPKCKENCRKSCAKGHGCQLECGSPCGDCKSLVEKVIPDCNHRQMIECFKEPSRNDCKFPCEVILNCGHQQTVPCHVKLWPEIGTQIEKNLEVTKCEGKPISDPANRLCRTLCDYSFACGHQKMLPCGVIWMLNNVEKCHLFPKLFKYLCAERCTKSCNSGHQCPLECRQPCGECQIVVAKIIPGCGHEQMVECSQETKPNDCVVPHDYTFNCGHKQVIPCNKHQLYSNTKISCKDKCSKTCPNGHECQLKCAVSCRPCKTLVEKVTPDCNHLQMIECYQTPAQNSCTFPCEVILNCLHRKTVPCNLTGAIKSKHHHNRSGLAICEEKCAKLCPSGHLCKRKCGEPCGNCEVLVSKVIPNCNHQQMVECYKIPTERDCQFEREYFAPCRHKYVRACSERFHDTFVCKMQCQSLLGCGHKCIGSCGSCDYGRLHFSCGKLSQHELICGHTIEARCSENRKCRQICENGCFHSRCTKQCDDDCCQCQKTCLWNCQHHQCSKPCKELCDRPACNERCNKSIICSSCEMSFLCYGVCGEMCMKLCVTCDPQLCGLDHEYVKQSKFITLATCGHSFECDSMDSYMNKPYKHGMITVKRCPKCNAVINNRSCLRYSNIVKTILMDIRRVQKLTKDNKPLCDANAVDVASGHILIYQEMLYKLELQNYIHEIRNRKNKLSNLEQTKYNISVNFLHDVYKTFYTPLMANKTIGEFEYVRKSVIYLLNWLNPFKRTFNGFELDQFYAEFDRVYLIMKISMDGINRKFAIDSTELIRELKEMTNFSDDIASEFRKKLQNGLDTDVMDDLFGWYTSCKFERKILQIVDSDGLWFKCPKGHYYTACKNDTATACLACSVATGDVTQGL